jgi:cytochrome d ubiquinol oxidase subunit I
MLSMALGLLTVLVPLQILLGDQHGLNTREHQPAKLAAIEAHWNTGARVPLILFALPDAAAARNRAVIELPLLGSLVLTHDVDGVVRGLTDWPPDQRPPVAVPFFAFRIMVGIATVMLAMVIVGWWLRWRRRLFDSTWYLRLCELTLPLGFVAVIAGWVTTEVGRQPWVVYGLLRTAAATSPSLTGGEVLVSLLLYMAVYLFVYPIGITLMVRLVRRGPGEVGAPAPIESGRPDLPVRALPHGG